ncbi:hypothetical protein [Cupriavidus sp. YAF13]|uniref:hypothetical protein n=1 Tax=Cupriavidus sp. YAF13 TaxID=3233075 RepID=UPI003F8EFBA1
MDLPIQSIESLRAAGRAAAAQGKGNDTNPFPPRGSHYRQWEHGHVWQLLDPRREEKV